MPYEAKHNPTRRPYLTKPVSLRSMLPVVHFDGGIAVLTDELDELGVQIADVLPHRTHSRHIGRRRGDDGSRLGRYTGCGRLSSHGDVSGVLNWTQIVR